jgi:translocation and assembly module TamB
MKRLVLAICLLLPLSLQAQTASEDRGFLEGLLEDALSGAGREVQVTGFRGALSSSATLETLTIADDQGVWLTLNDVTLNWNRAALLSGALDVTELSAKQLRMPRKPAPAPSLPNAQASPVQLPDLPVSVRVAKFHVANAVLGADVLGQAAQLSVSGSANLVDGSAAVQLAVLRQDGGGGQITLGASYAADTQNIALDLSMDEPQGGLVASGLGVHGAPPLALQIQGAGPISEFQASLALRSDQQTHLTGELTLSSAPDQPQGTLFAAQLWGDVTPLMPPEYGLFFGPAPSLSLQGLRGADGALELTQFDLNAQHITAQGTARVDASGRPQQLDILAQISGENGAPVLLPLPGPRSHLRAANLSARYDAQTSEEWQLTSRLEGLERDGSALETGQITALGTFAEQRLAGSAALTLTGLSLSDPALDRAIGPSLSLRSGLEWTKDAPVMLRDLRLSSQHFQAEGNASVARASAQPDLDIWLDLNARATDLSPFSDLAKRRLTGAVQAAVQGTLQPVSGAAQLTMTGHTQDLSIALARLDPMLQGRTALSLDLSRTQTGSALRGLLGNAQFSLRADAAVGQTDGSAALTLDIPDLAPALPELPGAGHLQMQALQNGSEWDITAALNAPGQNDVTLSGQVSGADIQDLQGTGQLTLALTHLDRFAKLAGRPLAGHLDGQISGSARSGDGSFALNTDLSGQNLRTGIEMLDALLAGSVKLSAQGARNGAGVLRLESADMQSPQGQLTASSDGPDRLKISGRLKDLAVLTPELSGRASLSGTAALQQDNWVLDLNGNGPGGATITATGRIASDISHADLSARGTGPLALANGFIRPMNLSGMARYDLTISGPLTPAALVGQITATDARLALPDQRLALERINAQITLGDGAAQLSMEAQSVSGGAIGLRGPVQLTAPFRATLEAQLTDVVLTDPTLYQTSVSGPLQITGGLTGGAQISGQLQLGPTELRVPNPSGADQADLPGLQHVNIPAAAQRTRGYAGLLGAGTAQNSAAGAFTLNLGILAPDRIFVRGRGLDAELGGALALKGDTANVIPEGRFELLRGRLDILGKRFELTEGLIQLQGAFDPFIRFAAQTDADGTTATIAIEGQASAPELSFTSSPSLPQDEVLALLLFGKDLSTISPLQAVRLAAAVRTLAGKGGDGIGGKVRRGLALDDLDVTTTDTGATQARAGKYINENVYSEITADTEGNSQINLNLSINRSVTARGRLTSDGETGIGVFIEKDY